MVTMYVAMSSKLQLSSFFPGPLQRGKLSWMASSSSNCKRKTVMTTKQSWVDGTNDHRKLKEILSVHFLWLGFWQFIYFLLHITSMDDDDQYACILCTDSDYSFSLRCLAAEHACVLITTNWQADYYGVTYVLNNNNKQQERQQRLLTSYKT